MEEQMKKEIEALQTALAGKTQEVEVLSTMIETLKNDNQILRNNLKVKQQEIEDLSAERYQLRKRASLDYIGKKQEVELQLDEASFEEGEKLKVTEEIFQTDLSESQSGKLETESEVLSEHKIHTSGELVVTNGSTMDIDQQELNEQLLNAAEEGDEEEVLRLIAEGADIESRTSDFENKTPLHLASESGFTGIVEVLLSNRANVDVLVTANKTPLYFASYGGHSDVVKLLLTKGAKLEIKDDFKQTALHAASESGYPEVVHLLIEKGANVCTVDKLNRFPMHYAAQYGHPDVVRELLSNKTPVDSLDDFKQSPLHLGAEIGGVEIIEMLFDLGTSTLQDEDKWKRTPLHYASWNGRVDAMRLLISKGARIDPENENGYTPLHLASEGGHAKAVQVLLSHGAKIDDLKWTPVHSAAEYGRTNVLRILLSHCTKPHKTLLDENQQSPLHVALLKGHTDTAKLLSQGSDVYQEDKFGQSPLLIAAVLKNEEMIRFFQLQGVSNQILEKYQVADEWNVTVDESYQIMYTSILTGDKTPVHPSSR